MTPSLPPRPGARHAEVTLAGWGLRAFGWIAGALALGLILSVGRAAVQLYLLEPRIERYESARSGLARLHAAMLDQETGARGYLMTHEARFLEPYQQGMIAVGQEADALPNALAGEPDLVRGLLALRSAVDDWQRQWAVPAARSGAARAGDDAESLDEGKRLFDAYRGSESRLADALAERLRETMQLGERIFVASVALQAIIYVALGILVVVQARRMRAAVETPVQALLTALREVRGGRLEPHAVSTRIAELRELGEGLAATTRALADERSAREAREAEARDLAARLRKLLEAAREFTESLSLRYVLRTVAAGIRSVVPYDRCIIWTMEEDGRALTVAHEVAVGEPEGERASAPPESGSARATRPASPLGLPVVGGLAWRAAKNARTVAVSASSHEGGDGRDVVCLPLIVGARVVGVIEVRATPDRLGSRELELLELLASHAGTAIESARLHHIAEEQSERDALTRLYNRRRLEEDLAAECRRSVRYERPLSVAMLDVDHFKRLNDTFGHSEGDAVLQHVAEVLTGALRSTDTAFRYGGEEFLVLMRETPAADGATAAERLRRAVEQQCGDPSRQLVVTASFGVAELDRANPAPRSLVEAADRALYEAKRTGRNRVVVAGPAAGPTNENATRA